MSQEEIRVGIVGADTKASWAKVSHVPAIKGLPGVRLAAVATRSERSAREAAEAFGADRWYSDPFAMIRDDRIDIVTIAVKVPAHRELVLMALAADNCEAPLGCSVPETEEMARAVRSHHTAIGLQGRNQALNTHLFQPLRFSSPGIDANVIPVGQARAVYRWCQSLRDSEGAWRSTSPIWCCFQIAMPAISISNPRKMNSGTASRINGSKGKCLDCLL